MMRFTLVASVVILLCAVSSWTDTAMAQTCSHVEGIAGALMPVTCGCPAQTVCLCTVNEITMQVAGCGRCEYCAEFEGESMCVVVSTSVARSDERADGLALVYIKGHFVKYSTGPYAGVELRIINGNGCDVSVNSNQCPCEYWDCNGDGTADGIAADCSALFGLEAGAAAFNTCMPNWGITSANNPMIGWIVDRYDPCLAEESSQESTGGGGGTVSAVAHAARAFSSVVALAVLVLCSTFLV